MAAAATSESASKSDDDVPIELPVLKYGFRTEPADWPELIQILTVEHDPEKLTRNVDQERRYIIASRKIKSEWRSIVDYILCTKFGFEKKIDDNSNRCCSYPPLSEFTGIETRLLINDFPYCVVENVEHWILWKIGGSCSEADIEAAKRHLMVEIESAQDVLHWINPPHVQSLPEIDHVHILVRRAKSE
ncbi:hypothetical protein ACA910_014278 [Epithemia clementina (nom. ined.)]